MITIICDEFGWPQLVMASASLLIAEWSWPWRRSIKRRSSLKWLMKEFLISHFVNLPWPLISACNLLCKCTPIVKLQTRCRHWWRRESGISRTFVSMTVVPNRIASFYLISVYQVIQSTSTAWTQHFHLLFTHSFARVPEIKKARCNLQLF